MPRIVLAHDKTPLAAFRNCGWRSSSSTTILSAASLAPAQISLEAVHSYSALQLEEVLGVGPKSGWRSVLLMRKSQRLHAMAHSLSAAAGQPATLAAGYATALEECTPLQQQDTQQCVSSKDCQLVAVQWSVQVLGCYYSQLNGGQDASPIASKNKLDLRLCQCSALNCRLSARLPASAAVSSHSGSEAHLHGRGEVVQKQNMSVTVGNTSGTLDTAANGPAQPR